MHGYLKTDVGGSNRGAKASPVKEVEGLPEAFRRGNRLPAKPGIPENDDKSAKNDGKTTRLSDPRRHEPIV
jgi:hypothetical protein